MLGHVVRFAILVRTVDHIAIADLDHLPPWFAGRGLGLALMEAKQPGFDCGSRGGESACGGESGCDAPGAGCPGHGLSRFCAETVGAKPVRGQPGAGLGDLDTAGDFELVASERDGADRYSPCECFLGRAHSAMGHGADRPLEYGAVRHEARYVCVERWEHLLLDRAQDQRAQQPVADASERPACGGQTRAEGRYVGGAQGQRVGAKGGPRATPPLGRRERPPAVHVDYDDIRLLLVDGLAQIGCVMPGSGAEPANRDLQCVPRVTAAPILKLDGLYLFADGRLGSATRPRRVADYYASGVLRMMMRLTILSLLTVK